MAIDPNAVRAKIEAAVRQGGTGSEEVAREVGFHMTDWADDLERLFSFFSDPTSLTNEAIEELLYSFLLHVPNHVAAASKLLTGVPVSDIFEVGATDVGGDVA